MNKWLSRLDKRYVKICAYAICSLVLAKATIMLLQAMSPVFVKIWELICTVLEPIVYGTALSYVLNPLVKSISRALRHRGLLLNDPTQRRRAAVAISLVLVLLVMLAISAILVLMVTHSIQSLRIEQIQSLLGTAQVDFLDLLKVASQRLDEWGILAHSETSSPLSFVSNAKEILGNVVFALIFAVYFLIDGPYVLIYLGRLAHVLFKDDVTVDHSRLMSDVDRVFSGYFRGQGIDAAIVGVTSGIVLTAIGVPFGPLVGLLAGLGNLIPYVGGPVGFGSIALVCLPGAEWGRMIAGFVAMAVIMAVDANIVNPKLLSDNVEVHPILVLAALIGGGAVGGIAGMLVAVPFAAFLKIQVDRWMENREAEEVAAHTKAAAAHAEDAPQDKSE